MILSQCMALAEFMLRTLHDSERTSSQAARLRSDLGRVSHLNAGGIGGTGGGASAGASAGGSNSNSRSGGSAGAKSNLGKEVDHRSRYLAVFEADDEAGVPAWHERPGAARAASRTLCADASSEGYGGWRRAWLEVLDAATAESVEDAGHLFFCTWRLLSTLPSEPLAPVDGNAGFEEAPLAPGAAQLEPTVASVMRIRACLVSLQEKQNIRGDAIGLVQWGLLSSNFGAALSMVCQGLPRWLRVSLGDLSKALAPPAGEGPSEAHNELLRRQFYVHGLVQAFAAYASAALAGRQSHSNVAVAAQGASSDEGAAQSGASSAGAASTLTQSLVSISGGLLEIAEECFRHYTEVVEAAIIALHTAGDVAEYEDATMHPTGGVHGGGGGDGCNAVGDEVQEGAEAVAEERRQGVVGESQTEVRGKDSPSSPELFAPVALIANCRSVSKSLARLARLGCDQYLVGGLHTELNYQGGEASLDQLPHWQRQACTRCTSKGSQASGKLSAAYAEPDSFVLESKTKGRGAGSGVLRNRGMDPGRKWEVMVNVAAWTSVRSVCELGLASMGRGDAGIASGSGVEAGSARAGDGEEPPRAAQDRTPSPGQAQSVDYVANRAVELCLSARSMLQAALRSVVTLTDALSSGPDRCDRPNTAPVGHGVGSFGGVAEAHVNGRGEAWAIAATRAVVLWGEISAHPWCHWFSSLSSGAFERLLRRANRSKDSGSPHLGGRRSGVDKTTEKYDLWQMVAGAWRVRRADMLLRLALAGCDDGDDMEISGGSLGKAEAGGGGVVVASLDSRRDCSKAALEEGLEQMVSLLAAQGTARDVVGFYAHDEGSEESLEAHSAVLDARLAEAIAAVVPGCPSLSPSDNGGARPGSTQFAPSESRATGSAGVLVPRGSVSTLTVLLVRQEFVSLLPRVLAVLRMALDAEARVPVKAKGSPSRPLAKAITRILCQQSEDVIQRLVALAVGASNTDCDPSSTDVRIASSTTAEDALAVLGVAVGYPHAIRFSSARSGKASQAPYTEPDGEPEPGPVDGGRLRQMIFSQLLKMAAMWAGSGGDGRAGGAQGARSMSSRKAFPMNAPALTVWLASKEGFHTKLAGGLMGVARLLARRLERANPGPDAMQVEGEEFDENQVQGALSEEEVAGRLARCLELLVTIFASPSEIASDEGCTDSEDSDSVLDLTCGGTPMKLVSSRQTTRRSGRGGPVHAPPLGGAAQQEPPLVCTFVSNQTDYVYQHWYHCYTCNLVHEKGCCRLCVQVCHRDCDVSYARLSCFYCDCGNNTTGAPGEGGDTPPASLENSPASSSGGEGLSASSPAPASTSGAGAAGGTSGTPSSKDGPPRKKCACLKPRTRREMNALLRPSPTSMRHGSGASGGSPPASGLGRAVASARGSGSRRQQVAGKKSGGRGSWSSSSLVSRSRAKEAAVILSVAAAAWRNEPGQVASMRAALVGASGGSSIVDELYQTYGILLRKSETMKEVSGGKAADGDGDGRLGDVGFFKGGGARVRPWDALCAPAVTSSGTRSQELAPTSAAASPGSGALGTPYLRCRAVFDSNPPVASYPILAPARVIRNGSLDVRLPTDGTRARQDRAAMALHGVVHRNLAATSFGRFAVAEAQNVLIVDPVGALALQYASIAAYASGGGAGGSGSGGSGTGAGGSGSSSRAPQSLSPVADYPVDRSHLCIVSSMGVGFNVIGLAFNPANERHLVAWGLRQCCALVLNSRGVFLRRVQVREVYIFPSCVARCWCWLDSGAAVQPSDLLAEVERWCYGCPILWITSRTLMLGLVRPLRLRVVHRRLISRLAHSARALGARMLNAIVAAVAWRTAARAS